MEGWRGLSLSAFRGNAFQALTCRSIRLEAESQPNVELVSHVYEVRSTRTNVYLLCTVTLDQTPLLRVDSADQVAEHSVKPEPMAS
jgi:hypothetical protein